MRLLITLALLCAAATAARAEIGTNMTEKYGVGIGRLFWVSDDGRVVAGECTPHTEVFTRSRCTANMQSVPETALFDAMAALDSGGLADAQRRLGEIEGGLRTVDARIMEELSIEPTTANEALRVEMERAAQAVRANTGEIAGVDDQLARILAELGRSEDGELRGQYRVYEQQRAKLMQERLALVTEARAALDRYTDEGVANDPSQFEGLVRERHRLSSRRNSLIAEIEQDLKDTINVRKLFQNMREDITFTYILGNSVFDTHYLVVGPGGGSGVFVDGLNYTYLRVLRGQ